MLQKLFYIETYIGKNMTHTILTHLINIGNTLEKSLNEVGIFTKQDLMRCKINIGMTLERREKNF